MMPRLDGYGLLQAVRGDPALREVPVILLSARAGEEARVGGLDAGADDYVVKPFAARELIARVNAHVTLARLRREAGQALRDTNEMLEARVAERTAEVREALARLEAEMLKRARIEETLRQAHKMEAIGQLTGGIAHDFNNLLTVIMGSAERIHQALPAESRRLRRDAELVMHGSSRAAALTHKLLAFSRHQPLNPQPTDISCLVSETTALLRRTLGETIELEGILAPRLWIVDVDRNQFENALLNLAVNARDAMPSGGTLTIATHNVSFTDADLDAVPELQAGDYVVVAVRDTGHGIAPDVIDRVFDPFFTTKEPGRGTGLGLSQVYGFIKQSGGHVHLESEPNRGTAVHLYLPRHAGELVAGRSGAADAVAARGNGEVILVVEDDGQVRLNTVEMLRDLGYQVLEAADAAAALRIGQSDEPIDLLFTDVVLPGKCSGRQLAEMLASSRSDMKVLYTTGYASDVIVHNGRLDAGITVITKPFLMDELAAKVRSVLSL
jgi:signal transduction histidine kinase